MGGQLHRPRFAGRARHSYPHSASDQTWDVFGIQAIATVIRFTNLVGPINLMQASSRDWVQNFAGFNEGAGETSYHRLGS